MIPTITASLSVVAWLGFTLYELHRMIESDGTWYNDLRRNGNMDYVSRAKLTINKRLDITRTTLLVSVVAVIIYGLVYVLTLGLLELV